MLKPLIGAATIPLLPGNDHGPVLPLLNRVFSASDEENWRAIAMSVLTIVPGVSNFRCINGDMGLNQRLSVEKCEAGNSYSSATDTRWLFY